MKKAHQSVPQLLEQYVFTVAAQFIEQLDKPEQDQLIQFIVKLDPGPGSQTELYVDQPIETGFLADADLGELIFETQTGSRNNQPAHFRQEDACLSPIDRLIATQQTHIDSTIINIARIAVLIKHTQNTQMSNQVRKNKLVTRYELFRDRYVTYLAKLQVLQEQQRNKLTRYQKQLAC
ncbi:hypothetical protein [Spirosoma agri]|uniref:Uncharacterized protein n=1 Tax=Spirosoma agri TaxID=1987381 RepID=A0A6M0IGZ4_9BACT|nr:hypothetical protein [Spirosoma agri]NEU66303.1 hypothetical protein [Spirosoma agri]